MEKSILEKSKNELALNELLAYTIAKLAPFEQARVLSHHEGNTCNRPPAFSWRFSGNQESIYNKLEECINSFQGNIKWTMNRHTRNYVIEPLEIYNLKKKYGVLNLAEKLSEDESICEKAIQDIPSLCEHIESYFSIKDSVPFKPDLSGLVPFRKFPDRI